MRIAEYIRRDGIDCERRHSEVYLKLTLASWDNARAHGNDGSNLPQGPFIYMALALTELTILCRIPHVWAASS